MGKLKIRVRTYRMSLLGIKEFYGQSLGVKTPCKVPDVSIHSGSRQVRVRVRVECACGVPWGSGDP